jgi:hypothetical protein
LCLPKPREQSNENKRKIFIIDNYEYGERVSALCFALLWAFALRWQWSKFTKIKINHRLAIPSWPFQPTDRVVAVFFDPSIYLPNDILTSALKTLGYSPPTSVRSIDNRRKYLVDIWGCYQLEYIGLK